ncbi:glyoxylase-like metal-dependent hydrolase (beta-lactamase superfamily II) [Rhizobium sp. BK650]|uniref:MBL fold metallo-hydrolase n=1 Tax=Rhizobium sp. BK650 TaxID=2586990 RepID=UPI00161C7F59|nr:MBL fold metallo-hydrolase [Rhizobium sp. BK650]MBB3659464.1 glyoxylase-like metal-dependent hydrolase (beta-lactamase superfamily II) [Rhizobium sp. BK650]
MKSPDANKCRDLWAVALVAAAMTSWPLHAQSSGVEQTSKSGETSKIAPIGVMPTAFMKIPPSARGPEIDRKKGYRIESLGAGLYMVTDNAYQSMFMVYDRGVVVVDAPPSYAGKIKEAVREVTDKPITHLIYSHSHADHIGGAGSFGPVPVIIAHSETKRLLVRDADPQRPIPTMTFDDRYRLRLGSQVLELSYPGNGHEPGNIMIYAPAQKVLMFVDIVFPGWMPFRRFGVAQDIPGYFEQVRELDHHPFEKLVGGHVSRIGTHEDVKLQIAFDDDIRAAASAALHSQTFPTELNGVEPVNSWAFVSDYTARVAGQCVAAMTPKWKDKLAAFDTFIWDQCYAMEQSLRVD